MRWECLYLALIQSSGGHTACELKPSVFLGQPEGERLGLAAGQSHGRVLNSPRSFFGNFQEGRAAWVVVYR